MKLFVVLFFVALASVKSDTIWEKFRGNRGYGGGDWTGGRTMGEMGMDNDNRMDRHHGLVDSREFFDREGGRRIGDFDRTHNLGQIGVNVHGFRDNVRVVDNVDKKFVKHDDDLRRRILGDNNLLLKQKFVLDVLVNIHKNFDNDDIKTVRIVDGETNYKNFDRVIDFFRMLRNKDNFLPRGRVFTVNNKHHRRQLRLLFNLFVYSKDFAVFRRNVLWARRFMNEEMFVHAFFTAVAHRDDMVGVKLPALYEILPHKFHTGITINKALRRSYRDVMTNKDDNFILNKYTKDYMLMNEEGRLAYLTEDIGWNLYHYFFHTDFGSWLGGKDLNLEKERRGEKYLFFLQQIVARYNLERFSNGLGKIKDVSLWDKVRTGYNPMMIHRNGLPFTNRKNYYDIRQTGDYFLMNRVRDFGRRIRDAIDRGYCIANDGGNVDLKRSDAVDILGNLIQSNGDSVNQRFYGGLVRDFARLLGGAHVKNVDDFKVTTSVMDHYETALRDPVTYQLYRNILHLYWQFKDNLPTYKRNDVFEDGVRVDNVRSSKLITYFDVFDVDITTITDNRRFDNRDVHINDDRGTVKDNTVVARHVRLNHKPFSINIDLTVDRPQKVVIRTFLGPKFDSNGKLWQLRYNRNNFVKIDKFTRDITNTGKVTIERHSRDFVYTVRDRTSINDIYRHVLMNNDVNKLIDMHVDEANCGFPDRLVLPKGWVGGMPMQIFVIVNKAKDVVKRDGRHNMICGKRSLLNEVDDRALGFPFDRRVDEGEFYTQNMLFKDVFIFHNDDLMKTQMVRSGNVGDVMDFNRVGNWNTNDGMNRVDGIETMDSEKMINGIKLMDSREKLL